MKWFGYLSFLFVIALGGCGLEEIQDQDKGKYQGTIEKEFISYQIRYFIPGPIDQNSLTIKGTFGDIPILAGVTDNKEVVFAVPDLPAGNYQLKLEIDDETRVWDVSVVDKPLEVEDIGNFWSNYFEGSAVIYDSLGNFPRLGYFLEEANKWSNHFKTQFSGLSQQEKAELIYLTYRNGFNSFIPFSFQISGEFENCLEENFAVFALNTFEEEWALKELKLKIAYLPSSKITDAFLVFLGDLIWRDNCVEEILAPKIFDCPIFKEVVLNSRFGIVGTEPIIFESGDSLAFEISGLFSPLSNLDGGQDINDLGEKVYYLQTIRNQRPSNSDLIYSIVREKVLDLPHLSRVPYYSFPIPGKFEKKPLNDFDFEVSSISNPAIVLSKRSRYGDKLFLTFEKLKEGRQDFDFSVTFIHDGFKVSKPINGSIYDSSEIILDLFFESGTAFLQVSSGQEPIEIFWSNGVSNQLQADFKAGNHSVKVRNGNGLERVVEFSVPEFGKVHDREGNEYQTVKIGEKWWMAENLRNTTRADGRPVQKRTSWPTYNPSMPKDFDYASYSYYLGDPEFGELYGNLYNIHAISGCLCPEGWEIPSTKDFESLASALGGKEEAGKMLKKRGNWEEYYLYSSNESGFKAEPGGLRNEFGLFDNEGNFTGWWAKNSNNPDLLPNTIAYLEAGKNSFQTMLRNSFYFEGHYVRCIKKD